MTRIALASVNRSMVTVRPLIWISGMDASLVVSQPQPSHDHRDEPQTVVYVDLPKRRPHTVYAALSPFHSSIVYGVVVGASVPPNVPSARPPPGFGAGASGTSQLIDGSVRRSSLPV